MYPLLSEKQLDLLARFFLIVSVSPAPGANVGVFIHLKWAPHLVFKVNGYIHPELVMWRRQNGLPQVIYSNETMIAYFKAEGADFHIDNGSDSYTPNLIDE